MKTETCCLPLPGMRCNACATGLERAAQCQKGVVGANCDPVQGRLYVEYVPGATDPETIRQGLAEVSPYPVGKPVETGDETDSERQARLQEVRYFSRHMWVSLVLTVPVLLGSLPGMLGWSLSLPLLSNPWFQAVLAAPVVFWGGASFFSGALSTLRNRTADMNTLVAVGTFAAYIYSLAALLAPSLFERAGADPEYYFEAAAVVTTLILVGRVLEAVAKGNTSEAIRKLMGLRAKTARVIRSGQEVEIPADAIVPGDMVVVRPGEKVPVDGEVVEPPSGARRNSSDEQDDRGPMDRRHGL
ncbi:MAG: hypothetical protein ACM3ZA_01680 [Bacillota bacterium]